MDGRGPLCIALRADVLAERCRSVRLCRGLARRKKKAARVMTTRAALSVSATAGRPDQAALRRDVRLLADLRAAGFLAVFF